MCCGTAAVALLAGLLLPWTPGSNLGSLARNGPVLPSTASVPSALILNVSTAASGYVLMAMKDPEDDFDDFDEFDGFDEEDFEDAFDDDSSGHGGDEADFEDDFEDDFEEDHSGSGGGGDEDDFEEDFEEDHSGSGGGGDEDDEDDFEEDHSGSGGGGDEDDEDDDEDDEDSSGEDHSGSGGGGDEDDEDEDSSGSNSGSDHEDDGKDGDDGKDDKDDEDKKHGDDKDDDGSGSNSASGPDQEDALHYSEIIDEDGFAAADREILILVDAADLERGELAEAELEIEYQLPALDLVMVRVRVGDDDDMFERLSELESSLGEDAVDLNHSYGFEAAAQTRRTSIDLLPAALAMPLGLVASRPTDLRLGMIDSAVNLSHSALTSATLTTRDFAARGGRTNSVPDHSHGTMIASIIVGRETGAYSGIAPGSALLAANVFFLKSDGTAVANVESMILAIDWLLGEGVRVINMSVSGPPNRLLERAIARAGQSGTIIVAAVGNAGPAAAALYPAAYDGVVAVTAIDNNLRIYRLAVRGNHVEFAAPGVDIFAALAAGGYQHQTGTSLAVPFVTVALAALRRQDARPWAEILGQLHDDALDLGDDGFDPVFGYGLIRGPGARDGSGYQPAGE